MGLREGTPGKPNHFDRGAAFYPLVMQYLVSLHGFLELLSRNLALTVDRLTPSDIDHENTEPVSRGDDIIQWYQEDSSRRAVTQLFQPLNLRSQLQSDPIQINPDELAGELFDEAHYLTPWMVRAGGILLIMAWETCKASSDQGQLWEFLRHCRNAAAHGSTFTFSNVEPRHPAAWGDLVITKDELQGSPLFREGEDAGLLLPGDPIRLLWDLEQAFPGLSPDGSPAAST